MVLTNPLHTTWIYLTCNEAYTLSNFIKAIANDITSITKHNRLTHITNNIIISPFYKSYFSNIIFFILKYDMLLLDELILCKTFYKIVYSYYCLYNNHQQISKHNIWIYNSCLMISSITSTGSWPDVLHCAFQEQTSQKLECKASAKIASRVKEPIL